jgi:hypothetical protein
VSLDFSFQSKRAGKYALVATALYFGSYYLVVEPLSPGVFFGLPPWDRGMHCRIGGNAARTVFTPAMLLEKKLYPRRWQFTAEDLWEMTKTWTFTTGPM